MLSILETLYLHLTYSTSRILFKDWHIPLERFTGITNSCGIKQSSKTRFLIVDLKTKLKQRPSLQVQRQRPHQQPHAVSSVLSDWLRRSSPRVNTPAITATVTSLSSSAETELTLRNSTVYWDWAAEGTHADFTSPNTHQHASLQSDEPSLCDFECTDGNHKHEASE